MVSFTLKQIKKKQFEKTIVETMAFQKKTMRKSAPQKIDRHEADQRNTLQRALHDLHSMFQRVAATDGLVISYLRSQVFACNPYILSCQTIKVYPNTNASRMLPKSPFLNEFSFGLVPFPVRLFNFIQTCPTN